MFFLSDCEDNDYCSSDLVCLFDIERFVRVVYYGD